MKTLILATNNLHKVREIKACIGPSIRYMTVRDFSDFPKAKETGTTFAENARMKAESLAQWLLLKRGTDRTIGWAVLADDSGLEVDALFGEPGVHSARFASADLRISGNAPDPANNSKLLKVMTDVPEDKRTARFRCALNYTLLESGLPSWAFEGVCEGSIITAPRGAQGFGYDPLFVPAGETQTFGELPPERKNKISHRAVALIQLRDWLIKRGALNPSAPAVA